MKYNNSLMKKCYLYPVLVLILFFLAGMIAIKDYGASADEHIQIESGHVIWRYLCQKFNQEVPEALKDVPDLHGFKNSYYGQAATFPTVVIEAIKDFTLDSSTVIRIRHYWNFLSYFIGLTCFSVMITHLSGDPRWSALWLLLQILLPRIFGDIFYNDRDIMLISWMMIFLAAFYLFTQRPGWFTSLLSAIAFGMVVNTRIFGLALLIFPFLYFLFSNNKKYILFFIPAATAVWLILSPIAWDDPLHTIPDSFRHFSTQQRYIDTGGNVSLLFFGKYFNETSLPWYYIPMYIVVTTPLMVLIFALIGASKVLRRFFRGKNDIRLLFGTGMLVILLAVPLIGIIFHLTFYNGWRHFYFLNLPITWLALEGFRLIWSSGKKLLRAAAAVLLCLSFSLSTGWIIKAHPYQIIYLSPVFREKWIGKFDRDYWILSTTECLKFLEDYVQERTINVIDKMVLIEYAIIGLPPQDRERFHSMYHGAQPIPFEYLLCNYNQSLDDDISFDYYIPVYSIKRDGIKLAEVYQRSHNNELAAADIVETVSASENSESAYAIADSNFETGWYGTDSGEIIFQLKQNYLLNSLEIFPANKALGFQNAKVYTSEDGSNWTELETELKGSNGISFPTVETSWLKLASDAEHQGIQDVLFYGTEGE